MDRLHDWTNRVAVQLYKHLPWLAARWARRHQFVEAEGTPWAPLQKPLRETVIALATTAGVHLKTQPPFNMDDPDGDPSFRVIPSHISNDELTITHKYYDHSAASRLLCTASWGISAGLISKPSSMRRLLRWRVAARAMAPRPSSSLRPEA